MKSAEKLKAMGTPLARNQTEGIEEAFRTIAEITKVSDHYQRLTIRALVDEFTDTLHTIVPLPDTIAPPKFDVAATKDKAAAAGLDGDDEDSEDGQALETNHEDRSDRGGDSDFLGNISSKALVATKVDNFVVQDNKPLLDKVNFAINSDDDVADITALRSLDKVNLAINSDDDVADVIALRDAYLQSLCDQEIEIRKNNSTNTTTFSVKLAISWSNFMFTKVFGKATVVRVQQILRYISKPIDGIDAGMAVRAEKSSRKKDAPVLLRKFYKMLAQEQRSSMAPKSREASAYHGLIQLDDQYWLYEQWSRLVALVEAKNGELTGYLASKGYTPTQGVNWKACLTRCITDDLDLSRVGNLTNKLQTAQGVHMLVSIFGHGIIAFLPASTANKIKDDFGQQKARIAAQLLHKQIPQLARLCTVADTTFLRPILDGEKPRISNLVKRTSLEELVEEIETGDEGDDPMDEGEDMDKDGDDGEKPRISNPVKRTSLEELVEEIETGDEGDDLMDEGEDMGRDGDDEN